MHSYTFISSSLFMLQSPSFFYTFHLLAAYLNIKEAEGLETQKCLTHRKENIFSIW